MTPASTSPPPRGTHPLDHLMVLRGIFCLAVVERHSYFVLTDLQRSHLAAVLTFRGLSIEWLLGGIAPVAVWGFFILSGYLIGKGFYRGRYPFTWRGIALYYGNRLKRILPLYYTVVLFAYAFVAPQIFHFGTIPNRDLAPTLFFSLNMIGPVLFPDIAPIWSLSTEMQFYLASPFLAWLLFKFCRSARIAVPLFTLLIGISILWRWHFCVVSYVETDPWIYHVYFPLWCNLEFFLAGFLATPMIESFRRRLTRGGGLAHPNAVRLGVYLFFLGSIVLFAAINRGWEDRMPWGYIGFMAFLPAMTMLVTVISIVLFELCATSAPPRSKSLPEQIQLIRRHPVRLFEVFGTLTYGIYVWHMPILLRITPWFTARNPALRFSELFAVELALTLLVAGLTYHFIEYPFDAKKKFK